MSTAATTSKNPGTYPAPFISMDNCLTLAIASAVFTAGGFLFIQTNPGSEFGTKLLVIGAVGLLILFAIWLISLRQPRRTETYAEYREKVTAWLLNENGIVASDAATADLLDGNQFLVKFDDGTKTPIVVTATDGGLLVVVHVDAIPAIRRGVVVE